MPKAKKFVLPYDGDPYNSGTTNKTHRGMRSEEAMERKRRKAIAHREAKQAALQQCEDGELLDSDVVDVPPSVDEPQAQVIVAEDALLEVLARPRKTRRGKRSEEAMERKRRKAIAHREAKQAALQQCEDGELLDSNVVDVPPNIDEPQTQVIIAEDALLEVLARPRKTRRGKRSEESMERRRREAIAHREAKQAALQQSEAAGPKACNCKAQVIVT
ncbi:hypothetical protein BDR05DRAFT_965574 [Suillus weaverae]|nr:hypothetical protein BDR05DRAFT_965574 [Suillus weaverae]